MIRTSSLNKKFVSYKKRPGFIGSLRAFFNREPVIKSAVQNFDLDIKKGEIVGLLGPNGAGKTTLMKMFTGIIVPSSGLCEVIGHNPSLRAKEFRKKIALVMGQKSQLWWDIPAMDSFLLLQKYYEISDHDFNIRLEKMSTLLDVKDLLHIHVRRLSLGERMKMELMASLLHSPEIIFLDEPTIGLDLVAQENIREFIKEYHREHNVTVIITSHYMADVQALCKRLVLIFNGQKAFDGPLQEFEKILGSEKSLSLNFKSPQEKESPLFQDFAPVWNDECTQVELRIPETKWKELGQDFLQLTDLTEFNTDKMPIEKVMKTLMSNPEILEKVRQP